MGVPKFYRWISERYPCLSEVVKEFQIPAFDNLYLDMNGVIHTCSHPNDDDPHFRITEEQIFANICHYIDFLFKMIKPKKVFFMAVDGVAPRAKMNQQRGRRFRTAKTAASLEEEAIACGEALPDEARFDSNCITPGTPFMVRLQTVLDGFAAHKMSTDRLWQGIRVYLSGHETPGEGEHKIMDFIRYEKSQPGYNPNTRHCLYGLDADLIMLGLCSHEPHFSLLREEVKFGGKKQKKLSSPEETTFHLLHISLLRDYLSHEFSLVKDKLSFAYDVEKIIDDFVLMSFLVGNDFIPHLPQLHIHHDAFPVLFKNYMDVLPKLEGYINEEGYLNLARFQIYLEKLAEYDFEKFRELSGDFAYLESKSHKKKEMQDTEKSTIDFLSQLGFSNLAISKTAEFDTSSEEEEDIDENSTLELEFNMHKMDYYMNKLNYSEVTAEVLKEQAEGYVRAIQWNLHYYYNGVVSWSWYYSHHYSPYISDIKKFENMDMNFDLGEPFLPFQQLLAVLPTLSKDLLPDSYQKLMYDKDSPLIDYYPKDFLTDLNGKQQEWEAIVLIPFINESLLLKCAKMADEELNEEERKRNQHGPHILYTYQSKGSGPMPSFLPGHFPSTYDNHAKKEFIPKHFFRISPDLIYKGLCKDVVLDKFIIGFPSLRTLKHTAALKNAKVKVFQMVSMKDNMMITLEKSEENISSVADRMVGKKVFVNWPHLVEAQVESISSKKVKYSFGTKYSYESQISKDNMTNDEQKIWQRQSESVIEKCYERWGIIIEDVDILVHVRCKSGSKLVVTKDNKVLEEKQFDNIITNHALQTVVCNVDEFTPDVKKLNKNVEDILPPGATVFVLYLEYYGNGAFVVDSDLHKNGGYIVVDIEQVAEPDLLPIIQNQDALIFEQFMPAYIAAQKLGMESNFISRITGTVLVQTSPKGSSSPNRVNVGLNLKFNRRSEEVQGYSRKVDNQWLYSEDTVNILSNFLAKFADFFDKIYPCLSDDIIYIEDLYPLTEGQNIVKEISNWLKEQTCTHAERLKSGMEKLDIGIVNAIEMVTQKIDNAEIKLIRNKLKPTHLYSPFMCEGMYMPDPTATFQLFDRVVNVWHSSSVPLGLRGTVVGIQAAEKESDYIYEVLFDKEFTGGFTLSSTSKKGYRMPPNALINISYGNRAKRSNVSPFKSVAPKLSRSRIFQSTVKKLSPAHTPMLLQYNLPKFNSNCKPFYKADESDMLEKKIGNFDNDINKYISSSFDSTDKRFVTPKAHRLSGGYSYSESPEAPSHDYEGIWANLKKVPTPVSYKSPADANIPSSLEKHKSLKDQALDKHKPDATPVAQKYGVAHNYGQKLSVEDLFQGAKELKSDSKANNFSTTKIDNISPGIQAPQIDAHASLLHYCIQHFKKPPIFSYNNYCNTTMCIATIQLPNGENISSIPCVSKPKATLDASEKAIAYINSISSTVNALKPNVRINVRVPPPFYSAPQIPRPMHGFIQPPYQPLLPSTPLVYNPFANIPPPFYDSSPLLRHPHPMHSTIPNSYVKANQMILSSPDNSLNGAPNSLPVNTVNKEREVYYLPGGGTASVARTTNSISKGSDNMFVPAPVMKQALSRGQDLEFSEWPVLPPTKPQIAKPTDGNKVSTDMSMITSKEKCEAPMVDKHLNPPYAMTVLKPRKKRIAANFTNSLT